jgi:hypothetical protein
MEKILSVLVMPDPFLDSEVLERRAGEEENLPIGADMPACAARGKPWTTAGLVRT